MKRLILTLALVGLGLQTQAQDIIYRATLKKEQVPEVILDAVVEDFPDYIVEEYDAVPVDYVEEDTYVNRDLNPADMDSYQILLSAKGKELVANYDRNGKLISSVENLKNVAPPLAVARAIETAYPGWTLTKDRYHLSKYNNGKSKEYYRLLLTKDGKRKRVYTDPEGEILK